ncbi:hypothetical protein [Flavobacterium sp.]|uniref:hypothetical protein n=1 Tax=Flavobacterium sp. TaxID=239 RepID=UPI00391DF0BB
MKKIFLLFAIIILFQSCFSYKAIDNDPTKMETGKTYKIERNNKYSKVVFHNVKDNTILVSEDFEEKQIPINDITDIQKRKLSVVKTVALPLSIIAGLVGLFALSYN